MPKLSNKDLVASYLANSKAIKKLEAENKKLKEQIMERAINETDTHTVKQTLVTQDRLESLKAIGEKSPKALEMLKKLACIKQISYTKLTISEK